MGSADGRLTKAERRAEFRKKVLRGNQFLGLRGRILLREQLRAQVRLPELRFVGGPDSAALSGGLNHVVPIAQYSAVSSLVHHKIVRDVEKTAPMARLLGHGPFGRAQTVNRKTVRHKMLLALRGSRVDPRLHRIVFNADAIVSVPGTPSGWTWRREFAQTSSRPRELRHFTHPGASPPFKQLISKAIFLDFGVQYRISIRGPTLCFDSIN
jgi:hypothetical protein